MFVYPIIRNCVLIKQFCSSLKAEDLRRSSSPENRKCSTHSVCSFCLLAAEEQRNTDHRRELHLLRLNIYSVHFTRGGRERPEDLEPSSQTTENKSRCFRSYETTPEDSSSSSSEIALHVLFFIFTLIFLFMFSVWRFDAGLHWSGWWEWSWTL